LPHLDAVSARFEDALRPETPWKTARMGAGVMDRMMRMILPFLLDVQSVEAT